MKNNSNNKKEPLKMDNIEQIVRDSLSEAMRAKGIFASATGSATNSPKSKVRTTTSTVINTLKEAFVGIPKVFTLKTEKLSPKTKNAHEELYQKYVESLNKVSSEQDTVNFEAANSNFSRFRELKNDEVYNANAVKLHELYFSNISDLASEVSVDSIPYIKLSRSFGSFDRWQHDFISSCMSAREGWAITYYDPYHGCYCNAVVDGHTINIPVGGIPIIVMDMWTHSYYKDYMNDKKAYVTAMMMELNWAVIEARMSVVEQSGLDKFYKIMPLYNNESTVVLNQAASEAREDGPIEPTHDPRMGLADQTSDVDSRQMSPISDNAPHLPASTQVPRSRFQG